MKSKKGILIPEVLKIILSVIAIFLLLYLAFSLYGLFASKTKIEQARVHIDNIQRIIENLEKSGGGSEEYALLNPKGWGLIGWPTDAKYYIADLYIESLADVEGVPYKEDDLPGICKKNNWKQCICLCETNALSKNILNDCDKMGFCQEVDSDLNLIINQNPLADSRYLILVTNDLIDKRKSLEINLENNKLRITTK